MLRGSTIEIPYEDIDYEIRDLCRYINNVEGIETKESCCGHGKTPCQIWLKANKIEDITHFIYHYLYRNPNWRVQFCITDKDIDENQWKNPTYLLETTFPDYHYVGLAIDSLKKEMYIKQNKI